MNNCILMAEIIKNPELRYTSDTQTPVAEMLVQFPGLRPEETPATLKVVGWGNLAQEIQERYHQGDRVVIEGRLSMKTLDRPEGFKEKQAELIAQRIHTIGAGAIDSSNSSSSFSSSASDYREPSVAAKPAAPSTAKSTAAKFQPQPMPEVAESEFDDIPF